METKKKNPWLIHLNGVRKKNPNMKFSAVMKLAKKDYIKKK